MNIPPDTKDWTWVLGEPCPECGFDASAPARDDLAALTREVVARWESAMTIDEATARRRPDPLVWSPLEYACHVRDVFAIAVFRLGLMLTEDDPLFANWDQDETAVADDYAGQDPATVVPTLVVRGEEFASGLSSVSEDQWQRPGRRGDGAVFTVESFARYLLHDPVHHLTDVTRTSWA